MANLNPTAYANGGITIPNGLVGMSNNPRGIPMHLPMPPPPSLGFPAVLTNMNSQRQLQMPMGQNPSPPITRNQVSYMRPPIGRSILRVFLFGEYLAGENTQNKKDIGYWRRTVSEFFSEEGRMIYGLWDLEQPEAGLRVLDIPNPAISRFFQVNFESGVTSIQLTMTGIKENFTAPVSINSYIAYNSTVEAKASLIYNYEDGSRVVASGRLKVRLNHQLKIDCFEFNTEKHMEYVPRQTMQTMPLPESPIGSFGIPKKTLRCLEIAEGVVALHELIEKSISSNKGPIQTLYASLGQSQQIINQSNNTPPTPGPSPPEPPAKTPKEKTENANPENTQQQYNNTDMPAPSPSTSNANIKDSPTTKPAVKSPLIGKGETTPKQKNKRANKQQPLRKNSRQEAGS